jgi:wobble nucleotide-excising tRNase
LVVSKRSFTSQDRSRRTCTQQHISKVCGLSKQTVVLSHEHDFLRLLWDGTKGCGVKALQLCRIKPGTSIAEWDIEHDALPAYAKIHGTLTRYRSDGSGGKLAVAQNIRLVLEGYLRFRFPGKFSEHQWLGDFIEAIRRADPTSSLSGAQAIVDELGEIAKYANKFHHSSSTDAVPIDDAELDAFVDRTLDLVGGF